MANVPYPITAKTLEGVRKQLWEVIRQLYEDKIGGADVGDVFTLDGDVLTLTVSASITKSGNTLAVVVADDGGLELSSDGVGINLDGDSLELSSDGIKVGQSDFIADPAGGVTVDAEARTAIDAILDLLIERGLMASE